jgi:hypothetical protein
MGLSVRDRLPTGGGGGVIQGVVKGCKTRTRISHWILEKYKNVQNIQSTLDQHTEHVGPTYRARRTNLQSTLINIQSMTLYKPYLGSSTYKARCSTYRAWLYMNPTTFWTSWTIRPKSTYTARWRTKFVSLFQGSSTYKAWLYLNPLTRRCYNKDKIDL